MSNSAALQIKSGDRVQIGRNAQDLYTVLGEPQATITGTTVNLRSDRGVTHFAHTDDLTVVA